MVKPLSNVITDLVSSVLVPPGTEDPGVHLRCS